MARVALVQLEIRQDESRETRISRVESILTGLANADLVILPEIWATGYHNFALYKQESEPLDGQFARSMAALARKSQTYLLAGSMVEKDGFQHYNTSLLFDREGNLVAWYRKIHLFRWDSIEASLLNPGNDVVVADTDGGRVCLSTCYDLRFPEIYREAVSKGAEIITVVAAWPLSRVEHWLLLARARAIENQAFVLACNCAGRLGSSRYAGHSLAIDPWGRIIAVAGYQPQVLRFEIDRGQLLETRRNFPVLSDRRRGVPPPGRNVSPE